MSRQGFTTGGAATRHHPVCCVDNASSGREHRKIELARVRQPSPKLRVGMAVDVLRLPTAGGLSTALHKHSLSLPAVASGRRPRRGKSVFI